MDRDGNFVSLQGRGEGFPSSGAEPPSYRSFASGNSWGAENPSSHQETAQLPPYKIPLKGETVTREELRHTTRVLLGWIQETKYSLTRQEQRPFMTVGNLSLSTGTLVGFGMNWFLKKYHPANPLGFAAPAVAAGLFSGMLVQSLGRPWAITATLSMEGTLGDRARAALLEKRTGQNLWPAQRPPHAHPGGDPRFSNRAPPAFAPPGGQHQGRFFPPSAPGGDPSGAGGWGAQPPPPPQHFAQAQGQGAFGRGSWEGGGMPQNEWAPEPQGSGAAGGLSWSSAETPSSSSSSSSTGVSGAEGEDDWGEMEEGEGSDQQAVRGTQRQPMNPSGGFGGGRYGAGFGRPPLPLNPGSRGSASSPQSARSWEEIRKQNASSEPGGFDSGSGPADAESFPSSSSLSPPSSPSWAPPPGSGLPPRQVGGGGSSWDEIRRRSGSGGGDTGGEAFRSG
uniref:Uncharacterized protein n=1 Tax=Chromera velia CCMP2878 TaxID=1169474 RepID=A0A0G4FCR9_9ALVE|eukprot:Cvel_16379.t1-p1 / transcript=Cvel_16379.t1 / gene=Cvel_16379 / organism=Chromera_velia_CCMP2878 / gene_product=hypothetical protein / transcript_product=hypothetical protein / location=Cvel_scaffold1259:35869-39710(-) / protein_length=449 / sequence_SO=supercontig / SO=protein_coding / is_pseudo=false